MSAGPIILFTDFGPAGPYTGQMQSVLLQFAPKTPVIDLISDAPKSNPKLASYLLAALSSAFPANSIFLSVVDPGVGGERDPIVLSSGGQYFVGPDNGLFNTVAVQSEAYQCWKIDWLPENASKSFHGRDLFAPIAARLASGNVDQYFTESQLNGLEDWSADLQEIIYFDTYGNSMTGIRYRPEMDSCTLLVSGYPVKHADTFSSVPKGQIFWYRNSNNLVEIAANLDDARKMLALTLGTKVCWVEVLE